MSNKISRRELRVLNGTELLAIYEGVKTDLIPTIKIPYWWDLFVQDPTPCNEFSLEEVVNYLWSAMPKGWKKQSNLRKTAHRKPGRPKGTTRVKPKRNSTKVKRVNFQVKTIEFTSRNPLKAGTLAATAFELAQRAMGVTLLELANTLRDAGIKRDPDIPIRYAESIYRLKINSSGRPTLLPEHLYIRKVLYLRSKDNVQTFISSKRDDYQIYRIWDAHKHDWY